MRLNKHKSIKLSVNWAYGSGFTLSFNIRWLSMMHEHDEGDCGCGMPHTDIGNLTEDQKKKMMLMHMDMKIMFLEKKIKDMENAIDMKKKMIASMKQAQTMFK